MFGRSQYQQHASPSPSHGEGNYYHQHTATTTTSTTQLGGTQMGGTQQSSRSILEVRSSFYTNNPLLYFSHYSEIVVSSGYDVNDGGRPTSAGMASQTLTSRRELVEQLDPEPLFDYLIQNGVLSEDAVERIQQEKSPAKTNLALLRRVEDGGKTAEGLLVIALRQTGQHHLANILDDSGRIKALSGSGYLSKSRHKGQLTIKVCVKAIKLSQECYKTSAGDLLHNREWLSVEDFIHNSLVNGASSTETSLPQFEIAEPENEPSKKSSCLCSCFGRLFSKNKSTNLENKHKDSDKTNSQSKSAKYTDTIEGWQQREQVSPVKRSNSEKFINLENIFRQKTSDFYELLCSPSSAAHTSLLKYFEQHRGLLVLDTRADPEGVIVINICTTVQRVSSLRHDYNSGKLTSDLQKEVVSEETLKSVKALGLKIMVTCEQDELDQVEQELS